MNGHLAKIVASLAVAGVLGAVAVYAKQETLDVRVTQGETVTKDHEERIRKLESALGSIGRIEGVVKRIEEKLDAD